MISNFPTKKANNQSGFKSFQFIELEGIATFPNIGESVCLAALSLKASYSLKSGYATPDTLLFSEQMKENEQGKYYEQTISGFMPGNFAEIISLMQEMDNRYFLVIVKDYQNTKRLVGYPVKGLKLATDFSGEASRSGRKGFSFSFVGLSLFRAPVYPF